MADITGVNDELTGLHNRRSFLGLLRRHILLANDRQSTLALLVVDVNSFALINGAHGYDFGDAVLRHLAQQLKTVARKSDYAARIGDNRFALILSQVMNRGHAELAVQKLNRLLDVPMQSTDSPVRVSITTGVALCPQHASQAEYLLRQAESALSKARLNGQPFGFAPDNSRDLGISDMWDLEMELENAIQRGEMAMHYQPMIRLSDLQPIGVEALMRWNSSSRGLVSPDVFIPLAERTGQIRKLTIWALNTALRQAGEWQYDGGNLSVAVNLPGALATQRDLPDLVENALRLWGNDKTQLVLEITERSLMDREQGFDALRQIRALGVKIAIDDFGTGYSCLAYFKDIPADELKIDKSFVTEMLTDQASGDITSLIIDLAHRFNLSVSAEGVEDEATLSTLKAIGCDVAQGYLFSKPMPSAAFQDWLTALHCVV
jgi:diguanylate cyclase (GGDEF)-like protein